MSGIEGNSNCEAPAGANVSTQDLLIKIFEDNKLTETDSLELKTLLRRNRTEIINIAENLDAEKSHITGDTVVDLKIFMETEGSKHEWFQTYEECSNFQSLTDLINKSDFSAASKQATDFFGIEITEGQISHSVVIDNDVFIKRENVTVEKLEADGSGFEKQDVDKNDLLMSLKTGLTYFEDDKLLTLSPSNSISIDGKVFMQAVNESRDNGAISLNGEKKFFDLGLYELNLSDNVTINGETYFLASIDANNVALVSLDENIVFEGSSLKSIKMDKTYEIDGVEYFSVMDNTNTNERYLLSMNGKILGKGLGFRNIEDVSVGGDGELIIQGIDKNYNSLTSSTGETEDKNSDILSQDNIDAIRFKHQIPKQKFDNIDIENFLLIGEEKFVVYGGRLLSESTSYPQQVSFIDIDITDSVVGSDDGLPYYKVTKKSGTQVYYSPYNDSFFK